MIFSRIPYPFFSFLFFSLVFLSSCSQPPLIYVKETRKPELRDTGSFPLLISGLKHHQRYIERLPPTTVLSIAGHEYNREHLLNSVNELLDYLINRKPTPEDLADFLHANYTLYQARGGKNRFPGNRMLVTGYYEPLLYGSLKKTDEFRFPLYRLPNNLLSRTIEGKKRTGRLDKNGAFLPYWSRKEIEQNSLLDGCELVYLRNEFDAFSLHIQGSGKIILPDKSIRSVRYAGSNGRQYNSIGKLLVDRKIMSLKEITMDKIREYLTRHPDEAEEIYYHNEKYIFFKWADTNNPPVGSSGVELTPGRSIAIDPKILPTPALGFLITRIPVFHEGKLTGWKPFTGIVLPQDSGAAIKGAGRVDLFWGNGKEAKAAAGTMKENGSLYFLIKKLQ